MVFLVDVITVVFVTTAGLVMAINFNDVSGEISSADE